MTTPVTLSEIHIPVARRHQSIYPHFKETGVDWLPKIPTGWKIKRLRFAVSYPAKSEIRDIPTDTLVSFVPMEAIGEYGGLNLGQSRPVADVLNGYTYFADSDVLVAKITPCFENGKGALAKGLENGIGFGTTELHVLRASGEFLPKFLFYLTLGEHFRKLGTAEMYGAGGQKRVPERFLKNIRHPIPPVDEQRAIAEFLDRETAKIDELIAKKKSLIQLLLQKRTTTIGHAVTKGLSKFETRPSGVDWMGDIPTHWETWRIKHACMLETGHTPRKSEERFWVPEECNIPWISLNDTKTLERNDFIDDTVVKISPLGMQNSTAHLIEAGAVVFTRDGARVGLAAITTKPMCVSQHLIAWVCGRRVFNKYLLNALYAMNQEIYRITAGATILTIGMTDIGRMTLPLPPIDEQHEIVAFLDSQCCQLDALIKRVEEAIHRLHDYRSSLVSAAVTGQIDVRHYRLEAPTAVASYFAAKLRISRSRTSVERQAR
jgi:type I restriction enzyme, S subunit